MFSFFFFFFVRSLSYGMFEIVYISLKTKNVATCEPQNVPSHLCLQREEADQPGECKNKTSLSPLISPSFFTSPAGILYKSIAGRYRPVSYPDGPITARYKFIKNAYWVGKVVLRDCEISWVPSLTCIVFVGRTCQKVRFLRLWLI